MKNLPLIAITTAIIFSAGNAYADQLFNDDLITVGSLCVGVDCSSGENFGFDTIRLKENNLRIKFQDTSSSSSFPGNDWQITINDSSNGGNNYFAIEDITGTKKPFYILAGAPDNSLYVSSNGRVGFGTSTPGLDLEVKSGNSPGLRLNQDASSGFTAQAWDVAGNETNFFVRDVTNGSKIPFKILPGAPNNSLYVAADGDLGLQTSSPDGRLDVAHPADANNHALLVDPSGNVGVNIDNAQTPAGIFDVQTTGGASRFRVASNGNVGVNVDSGQSPQGLLDVQTTGGVSRFRVDTDGVVKITDGYKLSVVGGNLFIQSTTAGTARVILTSDGRTIVGSGLSVDSSGNVTIGNLTVNGTCTGCQ